MFWKAVRVGGRSPPLPIACAPFPAKQLPRVTVSTDKASRAALLTTTRSQTLRKYQYSAKQPWTLNFIASPGRAVNITLETSLADVLSLLRPPNNPREAATIGGCVSVWRTRWVKESGLSDGLPRQRRTRHDVTDSGRLSVTGVILPPVGHCESEVGTRFLINYTSK